MSGLPDVATERERQALAIRQEHGRPVDDARPGGDTRTLARAHLLHIDRRPTRFERYVRDPLPIRRPGGGGGGGGTIGSARLEHFALILAVRIRDDELVVLAGRLPVDRDVGGAGRKCAAHADDLFVDDVADAMGCVPQCCLRAGEALRLAIVWPVSVLTRSKSTESWPSPLPDAADDHVVTAARLPVGGVHIGGARGRAHHLGTGQRLEATARGEVVGHDFGDVHAAIGGRAGERHDRVGDRVSDAAGDIDLQLRVRRLRHEECAPQRAIASAARGSFRKQSVMVLAFTRYKSLLSVGWLEVDHQFPLEYRGIRCRRQRGRTTHRVLD